MYHPAHHSMYYVAIVCPADVNEKVLRHKDWMKEQFGCMVALKSPAHITIIPPFWLGYEREEGLLETLKSFATDVGEVEIQLKGFSHFGKRVLFVHVEGSRPLEMLRIRAEDHFVRVFPDVLKKDDRPFHPHITIANRDMKPGAFIKAWQHFSQKEFKETFRTGTISLLKLHSGKWDVIGSTNW